MVIILSYIRLHLASGLTLECLSLSFSLSLSVAGFEEASCHESCSPKEMNSAKAGMSLEVDPSPVKPPCVNAALPHTLIAALQRTQLSCVDS